MTGMCCTWDTTSRDRLFIDVNMNVWLVSCIPLAFFLLLPILLFCKLSRRVNEWFYFSARPPRTEASYRCSKDILP